MPTATLPTKTADPLYALLISERDELSVVFARTKLFRLAQAQHAAVKRWMLQDSPEIVEALRDADDALEAEALRDTDAARMYARIKQLTVQIRNHQAALGLN